MMSRSNQKAEDADLPPPSHGDDYISPAPRVSVQVFCVSEATATTARAAAEDRRLAKAHLSVHMGGIEAAIEAYHKAPTPPLAPTTAIMRPTVTASEAENRLQIERTTSSTWTGPMT